MYISRKYISKNTRKTDKSKLRKKQITRARSWYIKALSKNQAWFFSKTLDPSAAFALAMKRSLKYAEFLKIDGAKESKTMEFFRFKVLVNTVVGEITLDARSVCAFGYGAEGWKIVLLACLPKMPSESKYGSGTTSFSILTEEVHDLVLNAIKKVAYTVMLEGNKFSGNATELLENYKLRYRRICRGAIEFSDKLNKRLFVSRQRGIQRLEDRDESFEVNTSIGLVRLVPKMTFIREDGWRLLLQARGSLLESDMEYTGCGTAFVAAPSTLLEEAIIASLENQKPTRKNGVIWP